MTKLERLTAGFQIQFEKFLIACDAAEAEGLWDAEANGEMEAWYTQDLTCIILKLAAADGSISAAEAKTVRDLFDFDYTSEELLEVFDTQREYLDRLVAEDVRADADRLAAIRPALADAYRELVALACEIVSESDGLAQAESEFLTQLRGL